MNSFDLKTQSNALAMLLRGGRRKAREWVTAYREKMTARVEAIESPTGDAGESNVSHPVRLGLSIATVRRRIACLQAFVTAAKELGVVDWKLEVEAEGLARDEASKSVHHTDCPSDTELQILRRFLLKEVSNASKRDLAMISLIVGAMLRREEIPKLKVNDLDVDDSSVCSVRIGGKASSEPEILYLDPLVAEDIKPWQSVRGGGGEDAVFVQIKRNKIQPHRPLRDGAIYFISKKRGRQAGLRTPIRPNALRRAGLTRVANFVAGNGSPLCEGMAVSRQKDFKNFWSYAQPLGLERRHIVAAAGSITR